METEQTPQNRPDFIYGYVPGSRGPVDTVTGPAHVVTNTLEANRDILDSKVNTKIDTTLVIVATNSR